MHFFQKSPQIFPLSLQKEMNVSLCFVIDVTYEKEIKIHLAGNSDYSVYLDGELIHYGPARAAIHEYRVDELSLPVKRDGSRLVVILPWYNCLTYTRVHEPPFFICEGYGDKEKVIFTSLDFACYRFAPRLQKVVRFSYQREFSEYYVLNCEVLKDLASFGAEVPLKMIECQEVHEGIYLPRKVPYCDFSRYLAFKIIERGAFSLNESLPPYRDRYMSGDYLMIFPLEDWERNPNDFVSRLEYRSNRKGGTTIAEGEFLTYSRQTSKTGFLHFRLKVSKNATVHFAFDEIDTRKDGTDAIGVCFYRNTTHNIISYELEEGEYSLFAAEPYTAKYVRAIVERGEIDIMAIDMIPFENPLASRLMFSHEDKDLEVIVEAARTSFAQNSTDILMDCPSRERAGWLCDTYFSGRAENLMTGVNLVERNFLENYAHYVNQGDQPDKMIPMCYPSDFADRGFIPNWPMFYILEIEEYLKRHDDERLLVEAKKQLFDFYSWCESFKNPEGLLENVEGVVFIEWSHANDIESTCGVSFPTNMLYSACLKALGRLYGRDDLVKEGADISNIVRKTAFNGSFFVDNATRKDGKLVLTERTCETTQYYAFHFGIATKELFPSLYETVRDELGPNRDSESVLPNVFPSNMFIGDYLRLLVLLENGDYLKAYKEYKAYFLMMAKKTGTLWEFDSTYASLTHCFASYAVNILLEMLTGITMISEKDKKVHISKYYPIDSGDYSLSIPTADSEIRISSTGGAIKITLPKGYSLAVI